MSTIGRRANTWTNNDGLVVGFGTNKPTVEGSNEKNDAGKGSFRTANVKFDYRDVNTNAPINVPVPAGSRIVEVKIVVDTAWAGAANALIVGDGSATNGFITTTAGAVANLTAGAIIASDGVYVYDDTADGDVTAREFKLYATADTIDLDSADTDWTAGSATLFVAYI